MGTAPTRYSFVYKCLWLVIISVFLPVGAAWAQTPAPTEPTPIMPIKDVRIGMKGYGLTVFHGTEIEPFKVEVISVIHNFSPKRGVIWVRCPDERMQVSGPVQGMSGSPIYLWPDGQEHEPGQGGLLIGAFALGFSATKDCYVGVQPIEQMRESASHAPPTGQAPATHAANALLNPIIPQLNADPAGHWRSRAMLRLSQSPSRPPQTEANASAIQTTQQPPALGNGRAIDMMMPLDTGSPQLAQLLAPVLSALGIQPVASSASLLSTAPGALAAGAAGTAVGNPPSGIDLQAIRLEPGSVLGVPLAFGDMDLSGIGTVTDVLPDGTVLGFGHSMFGRGPIAVPMATGYVHMIIPSLSSSFKLGNSAVIRGALVRDENSAVIGHPQGTFSTAPVTVNVKYIGDPIENSYRYEVVHHPRLTPFIASAVTLRSVLADRNLPFENTVRLHGQARFSGGHALRINSTFTDTSANNMLLELVTLIATQTHNPHETLSLDALNLTADVEPQTRTGSILDARIDRAEAAPGDTLGITLRLQPNGQPLIKRHIKLALPHELTEGDYELTVCDAQTYLQLLFDYRPHLVATTNVEEFTEVLQRILNVSSESLYAVLELPEPGLAIGNREFPQLPSSRRALFETPTNTMAAPYVQWIEKDYALGFVVQGQAHFTISVRQQLTP